MTEKAKLGIALNLRTKAWGIHFDGNRLHLSAVFNKLNEIRYQGTETLENYDALEDEEVRDFIEDFQSKYRVKRADAFMVLPRAEVQIQVAEFPAEAADNLEEVMEYQLANYFPGNLDELDFFPQIITKNEQLRVMIVAVKKSLLGHAFGYIRRWNLKLAGLSLDSFALVNGLARTHRVKFLKSKLVFFGFFPKGVEMLALDEGSLVTSYYFEPGADLSREELVHHLEQGFSQARLDPNEIDHYSWYGDYQPELRQRLIEDLGFPLEPWCDTTGKEIAPSGLPALGAAVSAAHDKLEMGLNMLPENQRRRHKRLPLILATVAAAVFILFFIVQEARSYQTMSKTFADLEREHDQLMERMIEVSDARSDYEEKQKEFDLFQRYRAGNLVPKLLFTLSQELPENTYLTNLQIRNGNDLQIQGESDDPFKTQRLLTEIPFLKDVKPGNAITSGRNRDGKKRFMFKATIVLEALR